MGQATNEDTREGRTLLIALKILSIKGTSLVVRWLRFHLPLQRGLALIPGQRDKILHACCTAKKTKTQNKQCCNKFNKDLKKNGPHQKKSLGGKKKQQHYQDLLLSLSLFRDSLQVISPRKNDVCNLP